MKDLELLDRLKESSSRIHFSELKIDILADVLILVNADLDLMSVAEACATDNSVVFQEWLQKAQIRKPDVSELAVMKEEDELFDCCLVKPFVFLQKALVN